jgi:hypothetical protein
MSQNVLGPDGPAMPAELVAPAVAYLCHESCRLTGEVLSAFAGRVARTFVAETVGYFNEALTVEDVATNLDTIFDQDKFIEPGSGMETTQVLAQLSNR